MVVCARARPVEQPLDEGRRVLCWLHGPADEIPEGGSRRSSARRSRLQTKPEPDVNGRVARLDPRAEDVLLAPRQLPRPAGRPRGGTRQGRRRRLARPATEARCSGSSASPGAARRRSGRTLLGLVPATEGSVRVRRARHHEAVGARAARPAPRDADRLPGPARVAQPRDDDRAARRAPARDPPRRHGRRAARSASPRRSPPSGSHPARAVHGQVPVRSLRRPEAAGRDRASDHPQPRRFSSPTSPSRCST